MPEVGSSNPTRAISNNFFLFVFRLFLYLITNFIFFVFINNLLALYKRPCEEPNPTEAVLVNAASLLYIRQVGGSNPTCDISKKVFFLFFFFFFILLQISSFSFL